MSTRSITRTWFNAVIAEWLKHRHGFSWFPITAVIMAALMVANGWYSYQRFTAEFLAQGLTWKAIWANVALLFGGLTIPVLLGVHAALSMRMEYQLDNIARLQAKNLLTRALIPGKWGEALIANLNIGIILAVIYTFAGLISGFSLDGEYFQTIGFLLLGVLGGWSISAVLLTINCYLTSISAGATVAVVAAISSFGVVFIAPPLQWIWPFTQTSLGMHARTINPMGFGAALLFIAVNIASIISSAVIAARILKRRK